MATWKENGVVPDSEDEDEWSSPGPGSEGDKIDGSSSDHGFQDGQMSHALAWQQDAGQANPDSDTSPRTQDILADGAICRAPTPELQLLRSPRLNLDAFNQSWSENVPIGKVATLGSSSSFPVQPDDISRSYVQISPNLAMSSSPLSSDPFGSSRLSSSHRSSSRAQTSKPFGEVDAFAPQSPYISARRFRPRKDIQLHPYQIEHLKYQQKMKASHIKPLRISEVHEGALIISTSGNEYDMDPEDAEFQGSSQVEAAEEVFPEDATTLSLRSTPVQIQRISHERGIGIEHANINDMSSDDDLPDLHELLSRPISVPPLKTYSKKSKQPLQHRPTLAGLTSGTYTGTPASPPTTSSPFVEVPRFHNPSLSLTSRELSPSWLEQDELQTPQFRILPTPATSAVKSNPRTHSPSYPAGDGNLTIPRPISISSDPSDTSSSEMDDIQDAIKRSRRVLPASHFRLDAGQQPKVRKPLGPSRSIGLLFENRPGVAIPRPTGSTTHPTATTFLIESDEDESPMEGIIMEHEHDMDQQTVYDDIASAIEYDSVDPMPPQRKRRKPAHNRSISSKRFRADLPSALLQPRITSRTVLMGQNAASPAIDKTRRRAKNLAAPWLSILDVVDGLEPAQQKWPLFIKIAARTSRSRKDKGKHSPSRKYIRLATREDTQDAETVLSHWRSGRIKATQSRRSDRLKPLQTLRIPLGDLGTNQTTLPIPRLKFAHQGLDSPARTHAPQRLVTFTKQRSMDNYVFAGRKPLDMVENRCEPTQTVSIARRRGKPDHTTLKVRPAQLESSGAERIRQFSSAAFRSTKKALDTLYRKSQLTSSRPSDLAMRRFLSDEDMRISASDTEALTMRHDEIIKSVDEVCPANSLIPIRRRKRSPRRIDANAAIYRQPNESEKYAIMHPNVVQDKTTTGDKLQGLGPYGTLYAQNFDVCPLQPGIRFQMESFIGCGRLDKALKASGAPSCELVCFSVSLSFAGKDFLWKSWNPNVSSEIGVCFDWIIERLSHETLRGNDEPDSDINQVINALIDYAHFQQAFVSTMDDGDFVSRMLEVLQDFKENIASVPKLGNRCTIEAISRTVVLAWQVVAASRNLDHSAAVLSTLENITKDLASQCIGLLMQAGLDNVRNLYDDLQYFALREQGIKEDMFLAQAWVMIMNVLETAKISKGSFWDLTIGHISRTAVHSMSDIVSMENPWCCIFSLLPLSEFDSSGALIADRRYKFPLENWLLPQQLLKRVFGIYNTNARQSPSFKDYCRALLGRCQHLIIDWGWTNCGTIIGTIFDFFAWHKLAHLRNEEVHKSPSFLEQLDQVPTLDIESTDCCFHVFLKIVAQAIQHMRRSGDIQGARNLISRLTPNHDRQYLKEEAIHQRDLASLRNHHDLLCTLYWSAPSGCEPAPSLVQNLVAVDRSHREACLINIRAWSNLARFVSNSPALKASPSRYTPFVAWQNSLFNTLLQEYHRVESQVHSQLNLLPQSSLALALVDKTISRNRQSTMSCIQAIAIAMLEVVKGVDQNAVNVVVNLDILGRLFDDSLLDASIDTALMQIGIEVLNGYLNKLRIMEPTERAPNASEQDEDSQGLTWDSGEEDRLQFCTDYIQPLDRRTTSSMSDVVRKALNVKPGKQKPSPSLIKDLVLSWSSLSSLVIRYKPQELGDFLSKGTRAVFQDRYKVDQIMSWWPLYLSDVISRIGSMHLCVPEFDLDKEWLLSILQPQHQLRWENLLTYQMCQKQHFLLISHEPTQPDRSEFFQASWPTMNENQRLVKGAIVNMYKTMSNEQYYASNFSSTSRSIIKARFVSMLEAVMLNMQQNLQLLRYADEAHKAYVKFVQGIASQIHSHASEICPLGSFFLQVSADYWPEQTDPGLYLAKLTSYALQLRGHNKSTIPLFYFLWNGFKKDLSEDKLGSYIQRVARVARNWTFLEYVITIIIPAAVKITLDNQSGWPICEVFLVAVSRVIPDVLSSDQGCHLLDLMRDLFKQFLNGLSVLYDTYSDGLYGFHPEHRGIIAVLCRFWQGCLPALMNYVTRVEEEMDEVFRAFAELMDITMINFEHGSRIPLDIRCFPVRRMGNDVVIDEMSREVGRDWNVDMNNGSVSVRMRDGGKERLIDFNIEVGPRTLRDVLINGTFKIGSLLAEAGSRSASLDASSRFLSMVF